MRVILSLACALATAAYAPLQLIILLCAPAGSAPLPGSVLGAANQKSIPTNPSSNDAQANGGDQGSEGAYR
eukprot:7273423-Pyramimonas_sp.AAC.1